MTSIEPLRPFNGSNHTNGFAQGHSLEEIARALGGQKAHRSGKSWVTCCPAHEDRDPSLSLSEGSNGELLVHCHAGCSQLAVLAALRRGGINVSAPRQALSKLEAIGNIAALQCKGFRIAAAYDYRDECGVLLYQNLRIERYGAGGERTHKTFRQRRPDPSGIGWIENLNGIRRVPYRLPGSNTALGRGRASHRGREGCGRAWEARPTQLLQSRQEQKLILIFCTTDTC